VANHKETFKRIEKAIGRHRVDSGKGFRLRDHDPGSTGRMDREDKKRELASARAELERER
jgi:hypothetical protein